MVNNHCVVSEQRLHRGTSPLSLCLIIVITAIPAKMMAAIAGGPEDPADLKTGQHEGNNLRFEGAYMREIALAI